jgi:pyruvate-formate lyase-activating enzyme
MSPGEIVEFVKDYARFITVREPKERATSFHAHDLCHHCGACVREGKRSDLCPNKLKPEQILLSPQGYGPARNIVAFTGGDIACQPEWYCQSAMKIKELNLDLWVLFETNGYGLTPKNLDLYKKSGIDSFWLDIKAWNNDIHKELTGVENHWILRLPEEILKRDFTLEVLSLYIPRWVETDQIREIAKLLVKVDRDIPFTILAFFGSYKLEYLPSPSLNQMLEAYKVAKEIGLKNVRLGNLGCFLKTEKDYEVFLKHAKEAI